MDTENIGIRQDKETAYNDFVELVKKKGTVRASLSHTQSRPSEISSSAILDWQIDDHGLFCVTITGGIVRCSDDMPAFHVFEPQPEHKPCPRGCGYTAMYGYCGSEHHIRCIECDIRTGVRYSKQEAWADWDKEWKEG